MTISNKNESEHCWEFMNCSQDIRKDCFAYKSDTEKECWFLNQISKRDGCNILGTCKSCPWFLNNNPNLNKEVI
jgi:hypothetical protein